MSDSMHLMRTVMTLGFNKGDFVELGVQHVGIIKGTFEGVHGDVIVLQTPEHFGDTTTTTKIALRTLATWKVVTKAA